MKSAYILMKCEEYTDPKVVGVTLDRAKAEAWQAKRPVKYIYQIVDFLDVEDDVHKGSVTSVLL